MNKSITKVFVEQPLASPRSANNRAREKTKIVLEWDNHGMENTLGTCIF